MKVMFSYQVWLCVVATAVLASIVLYILARFDPAAPVVSRSADEKKYPIKICVRTCTDKVDCEGDNDLSSPTPKKVILRGEEIEERSNLSILENSFAIGMKTVVFVGK